MDTIIDTYLKIDGFFVPIDEVLVNLADEFYITGAILWKVDGRSLMDLRHWDLVDQLWAYIVEGLSSLDNGQDFQINFPDQPLLLAFRHRSSSRIDVQVGENITQIEKRKGVQQLSSGAKHFFERMLIIQPSQSFLWESALLRLNSIK